MTTCPRSAAGRFASVFVLISALSLGGLSMSHAAQPHLSEADTVSGLSCVDLCATSKSWLDRFMATFRRLASPRPQVQLIARYTPRLAGDLRPATRMTTAPRLETGGASVTAPGS